MKLPYKRCSPQSSGNSGKAADGDGTHLPVSGECILGIHQMATDAHAKLSPTVLKRFENFLRQRNCSWNTVSTYIKTVRSVYHHRAVDRKYIRYVPRLFEHVYTGTRADRKKALEASDISSLVRRRKGACKEDAPKRTAKQGFSSVLMFMLRAYLSWIWHTRTKGPAGKYTIDRRRKTGRADRVTHTRSHADGENNSKQGQGLSLFIPMALQSEEGSEAAYQEYQSALRAFNQRLSTAVLGMQSAPKHLCSQTHLPNGMQSPRNHIGHGALLHH